VHAVRPPVTDDLDVAVKVRAVDGDARMVIQRRQGLGCRMAVLVALTRGDHGDARAGRVQQAGRGRRRGAVVPHLEQIDGREDVACEQRRLHRCLGVAGEQRGEAPVTKHHHDRTVVDVAVEEGRSRILRRGEDDLDPGPGVQREAHPGAGEHDRCAGLV
jgi:hypothetical protein